jgi:hypothetical protein
LLQKSNAFFLPLPSLKSRKLQLPITGNMETRRAISSSGKFLGNFFLDTACGKSHGLERRSITQYPLFSVQLLKLSNIKNVYTDRGIVIDRLDNGIFTFALHRF